MSKFEDGSYGSAAGIALIAKVLAGRCPMQYTRVAVGKGNIPEGESPRTMQEPADYVMDAVISGISNPVGGECQVTIQINSAYVEKGFYCTGVVLYAADPDEGEVPYTYLVLENEPEWIRPSSSIVGKLTTIDLIAAVGDVDTVKAVIDPESIATAEQVARMIGEHAADPDAHAESIRAAVSRGITELQQSGAAVSKSDVENLISAALSGAASGAIMRDITLPTEGWEQDGDAMRIAVPCEEALATLFPIVAIHRDCEAAARAAGLSPSVETLDGALRFWSGAAPETVLEATVVLIGKKGTSNLTYATEEEVLALF